MNILKAFSVPLVVALLSMYTYGHAAAASGSFNTKITLVPSCSLTPASDVDFGTIDLMDLSRDLQQSVSLTLTCSKGVQFSVALSPSNGANLGNGVLTNAQTGATIPYTLSSDPTNTVPWGNLALVNVPSYVSDGFSRVFNVYVTVPRAGLGALLQGGSYSDTVGVGVTY